MTPEPLCAPARFRAGTDESFQEQMILQWVSAHGRITRREAAELRKVGPFQASRPLRSMTSQGEMPQRGSGKGHIYDRDP